ncbi:MAG: GNAT family N-acetyltransferase [Lachnospiraceae bacterium]|nr:GNAT family N-acetyltransferase [Lachnospiraceae bacterium]
MNSSFTIRMATIQDVPSLLAIYEPYVLHTEVTFEYDVPTLQDFASRVESTLEKFPYLVCCNADGKIFGYAYASSFKGRAAYNWSVETSIYVDQNCHHKGIGKILYDALEDILKKQQIRNVCACIAYPNPDSVAFHEYFGYQTVAHFHHSGFKHGKWLDMIWMEKFINEHISEPEAFIPITQLTLSL